MGQSRALSEQPARTSITPSRLMVAQGGIPAGVPLANLQAWPAVILLASKTSSEVAFGG